MLIKHYLRFLAPEPVDTGGALDRGDDLDLNPDDPDGKLAAADAIKDDPKVKALETEIEADEAGNETDPKKDTRIPQARHKEILEKERAKRADLERQLAQFQQGGQIANVNAEITAAENTITKLWSEYSTLISDGEVEKAAIKQQQITATERQMAEAKSDMKIHAAEIRATERARYSTALERVEAAFPTLNPDHDDFDAEAMNEVAELKLAYESRGLTPTAALQKAVKLIVEPRTSRQEAATDVKPAVTPKDIAAQRKIDATLKSAKAIAKTPASLNNTGLNSDQLGGGADSAAAVMRMSQKEFAALSDEALSKMRGDTL